MRKQLISALEQEIIRSEIAIHSMVEHDNIIRYVESYEDSQYFFIIMECVSHAMELYEIIK